MDPHTGSMETPNHSMRYKKRGVDGSHVGCHKMYLSWMLSTTTQQSSKQKAMWNCSLGDWSSAPRRISGDLLRTTGLTPFRTSQWKEAEITLAWLLVEQHPLQHRGMHHIQQISLSYLSDFTCQLSSIDQQSFPITGKHSSSFWTNPILHFCG